ncbi:MAG: hypothetical protein ACFB10_06060 [Salibacteraceae bacterium]
MDLRKKYQEGKQVAIELMRAGDLKAYIEKLKELENYKWQLISLPAPK